MVEVDSGAAGGWLEVKGKERVVSRVGGMVPPPGHRKRSGSGVGGRGEMSSSPH